MRDAIIDLMLFITKSMCYVLDRFYIQNQMNLFDPHVGDTACQIRACMLARIKKLPIDSGYLVSRMDELNLIHIKLEKLKSEVHPVIESERNNHFTVIEFIHHIGAYFHVTYEEKILFQSYFLTLFKKEIAYRITVIDYDKICSNLQISRKMAKKITRHYQLAIAHESCSFISQCTNNMSHFMMNPSFVLLLRLTDDDGREVLPCYFYTKIILEYAKQQQIPLLALIKINDEKHQLCFIANEGESFAPIDKLTHQHKAPCIVITAHTKVNFKQFHEELAAIGIETMLLSAMADHVQYTGNKLSVFAHDLQAIEHENSLLIQLALEINEIRKVVKNYGCSQHNHNLFSVEHIYCDLLQQHAD
jgi:hypothetical protein